MRNRGSRPGRAALELAREFDDSFARAAAPPADADISVLLIRIGSARYAVRLSQLSGVFAHSAVTHVPGAPPAMLGLTALRGAIVPVYDLAALLGQSPVVASRSLLVAAARPVALAVELVESCAAVPVASLRAAAAGHATEMVRIDDDTLPVLSVDSVLESIAGPASPDPPRTGQP